MPVSMWSRTLIGGVHGLPERCEGGTPPTFIGRTDLLLANARSGLALLIEMLSPRNVWLPSYICDSMVRAVPKGKTNLCFYGVDEDLSIPSYDWLLHVRGGDIVLLVDYFGFLADGLCASGAREAGAWLVEDASHALLSKHVGLGSDFVLYSPRKFLGVPDGGILANKTRNAFHWPRLEDMPQDPWKMALDAVTERREFDARGGSRHWFETFQQAESAVPIGPFKMSALSEFLLNEAFDYEAIANRRVENYRRLCERLPNVALFPVLEKRSVPLGFPIRVPQRDRVRQQLFAHEIYPPVHWPVPEAVPVTFSSSRRLASEIMTLPCDQRYEVNDMDRMSDLVAEALQ